MKESHTGIGVCHCQQCRFDKKHRRGNGKRAKKRAINKFRRRQLKLKEAFAMGAQWQKEQSPWISVENQLPEKDGTRVWVKSSCLNHQPLIYSKGKFYARLSDGAYDGSVTHWMEIPQ